jgi:hypothetical protein
VHEFINEVINSVHPCHIVWKLFNGGQTSTLTKRGHPEEDATHVIWIINAQGDDSTLSYIEDNIEHFKKRGFQAVFGLRDLYTGDKKKRPVDPDAIDGRMRLLTSKHGMQIEMTVAIHEIEAWFLSAPAFFERYDKVLTVAKVKQVSGLDLETANVESLDHPASVIHHVLESVNLAYKKRLGDAHKIANALDYATLYAESALKIKPLGRFVRHLTFALA